MQYPISDCAYPIQLGGCICGSEYCPLKLFTRSVGFFTPDALGHVSSASASARCESRRPPCKGRGGSAP